MDLSFLKDYVIGGLGGTVGVTAIFYLFGDKIILLILNYKGINKAEKLILNLFSRLNEWIEANKKRYPKSMKRLESRIIIACDDIKRTLMN